MRLDLRSPDLGPSRSAQYAGQRNLKDAFDAQPDGGRARFLLRTILDDGPVCLGPVALDDGPIHREWDVLEFDALLTPLPGRSLVAVVTSPPRSPVASQVNDIEATICVPLQTPILNGRAITSQVTHPCNCGLHQAEHAARCEATGG